MSENKLEQCAYSDYCNFLYEVALLLKNGILTKEDAYKISKRERILQAKERKSLIVKLGRSLGVLPCNLKHMPQYSDMALYLMNILGKEQLCKEDITIATQKEFYEKYFKGKWAEYYNYSNSYDGQKLTKSEFKECMKVEREIFEKLVPPFGEIEELNL